MGKFDISNKAFETIALPERKSALLKFNKALKKVL